MSRTSSCALSRRADGTRLPLTSAGATDESIREALVDLLGKATDGEVEAVSEGEWKLFDKRQHRLRREA